MVDGTKKAKKQIIGILLFFVSCLPVVFYFFIFLFTAVSFLLVFFLLLFAVYRLPSPVYRLLERISYFNYAVGAFFSESQIGGSHYLRPYHYSESHAVAGSEIIHAQSRGR